MSVRNPVAALSLAAVVAASACDDKSMGVQPRADEWSKFAGNPVLSRGIAGSWDDLEVAAPMVLEIDTDSFMMWYTGRDSTTSQIGLAISHDGMVWEKYSGNPILSPGSASSWDELDVEHPNVLYDGSSYRMYYTGRGRSSAEIGLALSTDGIHWLRSDSNPVLSASATGSGWDDRGVYTPWVLFDGRKFEMWYGGAGKRYFSAVGYASSTDGVSWTKVIEPLLNPQVLEALTFSPCVIKTGSTYRMWYGALHENSSGGIQPGVIDYAQSQDGLEWTWNRTVLSPGPPTVWDEYDLKSASVLDLGNKMRMWYEGNNANAQGESSPGFSSIGLATYQ